MDALRRIWAAWKRIGQAIGDTLARVVLSLFYFTIFMPFALGVRLFVDPLGLRNPQDAAWVARPGRNDDLNSVRRLS